MTTTTSIRANMASTVSAICEAAMRAFAAIVSDVDVAAARAAMGPRFYDEATEALRIEVKRALTENAAERLAELEIAPEYAMNALIGGIVVAARARVLASV